MSDERTPAADVADHTPHCRAIGIQVVSYGEGEATVRLPYREELVGDPVRKVVFGGVITTLLDHASGIAVFTRLREYRPVATLDLRIDYLRAAEPGCDLVGRVECYKIGGQVAFVRGTAWDRSPDDPFASVHATMMLGANTAESLLGRALHERVKP